MARCSSVQPAATPGLTAIRPVPILPPYDRFLQLDRAPEGNVSQREYANCRGCVHLSGQVVLTRAMVVHSAVAPRRRIVDAMNPASITRSRRGLLTSEPLILLALVMLGLYFAREVLIPLAMALTLNFLLAPAVIFFEKLRLRRVSSVALVVFAASAVAAGVGFIVARQIIGVVNELPNYRQNIRHNLSALHMPTTGPLGQTAKSLQEIGETLNKEENAIQETETDQAAKGLRERERKRARIEEYTHPT